MAERAPLTVLQVVKGLDIGGHNGGAERFGADLALALAGGGTVRACLCSFYRHDTPTERALLDRLEEGGVSCFFALENGRANLPDGFGRMARFCRQQGVGLVHSHFQVGSLAAALLRLGGVVPRVMRTAHISQEWGSGFLPWLLRQALTKWLYPLMMDQEAGVSAAIVDQLKRHPGSRLTRRAPRMIPPAFHFPQSADEPPCRETGLVGSVGRLTARKGYPDLLRAMPAVIAAIPAARLSLVGDGEQRGELEALARSLDIAAQVTFLGQRADVAYQLGRMELFVLPSRVEGIPIVLMEAMACQTPVLATDIPGTRELVRPGHNGWLAPPADAAQLAQAIIAALRDPNGRAKLAANALAGLEPYRIEAVAGQYAQLYMQVMANKVGRKAK